MPRLARVGCSTTMRPRRQVIPTPVQGFERPSMSAYNSVAVVGAGAWGTALAGVAARAGRDVVLCARRAAIAAEIAATRANSRLPGAKLDAKIEVTGDIALAARADVVLVATPAQDLRAAVTA